jgi:hypothetical protein
MIWLVGLFFLILLTVAASWTMFNGPTQEAQHLGELFLAIMSLAGIILEAWVDLRY